MATAQQRARRRAQRATAKAVRTGTYQRSNLDKAIEFAESLPDEQHSYILGQGDYNNSSKYKGKQSGYAALSSWAMGNYYGYSRSNIQDEKKAIFQGGSARSYVVRWAPINE